MLWVRVRIRVRVRVRARDRVRVKIRAGARARVRVRVSTARCGLSNCLVLSYLDFLSCLYCRVLPCFVWIVLS